MKKIYSILVAAAMVLGATSCQKDAADEAVVNGGGIKFTASLNATRTELGEGNKVMWQKGDQITVYTQENTTGVVFDGDAEETTPTATFTTSADFTASTTGYFAVHPANSEAATYAAGVWQVPVSIADTQYPTANTYDPKNNFTVAYSTTTNLSFKPGTALLKFTYTGTQGFAYLCSSDANLYGTATLNYNTADNTISYTDMECGNELFIENLTQGETYYLAIFPGTASNLELYDGMKYNMMTGAVNTPIFKYSKEIEFEAGKIYTLNTKELTADEDLSPWSLFDPEMYTQASMTIDENEYHVAKAVPEGNFVFYSTAEGEQFLLGTKDLALYEWQATTADMNTGKAISIPASNMFDIYLAPDASMFCIVDAGGMVPAMPEPFVPEQTLWAISGEVNNWGDTFLWTTETEGLLVAEGVTFETDYSEFKFRYDSAWEQQYTSEVYGIEANMWVAAASETSLGNTAILKAGTYNVYLDTTNNKIYVVEAGAAIENAEEQTESNYKPIESAGKLYLVPNSNWKIDNARFAAYYFGNGETWVSMTDEDGDGTYECELPEGYPSVIFCRMNPGTTANNWNNKWNQTADLTVPTDGTNCYTVTEGTWDKGGGTWSTK